MATNIDYTVQGARRKYHIDPTPSDITKNQLNNSEKIPYHLYRENPHLWSPYGGNVPGSFQDGIYTKLDTEKFAYGSKPTGAPEIGRVCVLPVASRIAIPPMGATSSWRQYCKNIQDQLVNRIYLLSPMRFYQSGPLHGGRSIDSLSIVSKPNTAPTRRIFHRAMEVVSLAHLNRNVQEHQDTKDGYYTDTALYPNVVKSNPLQQYEPLVDAKQINAVKNNVIHTTSERVTPVRFSDLTRSTTSERTMSYSQSYLYFTDLRPPEVLVRQDDEIRSSSPTKVIARRGGFAENTIQMLGGVVVESDTAYLEGKIDTGVYNERWYNNHQDLTGSLAHYVVPNNRYYTIYPRRFDAIKRNVEYQRDHSTNEVDLYSCLYSIETNDSVVVIEVNDRYLLENQPDVLSTWLSIPKYQDGEMSKIDHARYRHLSLFHINGSNNRIILKIGTEKLPARFVHSYSEKDYLNLFSFASETKSNMVLIAYTQEDIDKRVSEAENYFRLNDPPEGYTEDNRDRYSVFRTYRASAGLVETLKLQPHLPPGPTLRLERYFGTKNSYNIYHAYPCYPRATYYPNTDKAHVGIDKDVLPGTVRVGIVMRTKNTSPYQDSDGIIKNKYQWEIPSQLADRYPNPSTGSTSIYQRTWNYHLQEYYNEYVREAYKSNNPNPSVMYRYHMTYPDPAIDGSKYSPVQLGSCINYAAMLMHVIVNDPPSAEDKVERIIVFEGLPDGQPIDLHFRSVYPIVTPLCVSGNDLNITFVIRCKLNLIVDLYDNETKNEPINYCFITINGVRNKVKIIYDEGCYIRFIHRNNKQHFRYRYLKMGHGSVMSDAQANTNEVRVYQREEGKKITREYEYIRPEGNREHLFAGYTPATNADLDRATHYKMRPYRDEDILRTGRVLHIGGGDQYIGFVSRNGG